MRLLADTAGNVLPMVAVASLVGVALVGGGVDISRAYKAENRMQAACDSAALAGRKAVTTNGFDSEAEETANSYFATNFDETAQEVEDVVFTASSEDNGQTVLGHATAKQDTALMRVFGFNEFNLEVDCFASMGVGNSDVVMVLDSTGSMAGGRIASLRTAMKNFYDTLDDASSGTTARIRYGFVPFSQSVNVGHLLDPNWIVDEYDYASRRPDYDLQVTDVFDHWGDPVYSTDTSTENNGSSSWEKYSNTKYSKKQCKNALPDDTDWEDYGDPYIEESSEESGGQYFEIVAEIQPQRRMAYDCRKDKGKRYIYVRYEYRDLITTTTGTSDAVYTQQEVEVFDRWVYDQVTHDTSIYKTFQSANALVGGQGSGNSLTKSGEPVSVSSLWGGCIIERATVPEANFSYNSVMGMSPSDALDLNIDLIPDPADPDTQWAPMWPEVSYRRWNDSSSYTTDATFEGSSVASDSACPSKSQLLAEMDEAAFDAYADALDPQGYTYLDIGMIWGGRLSSPTGPFSANVAEVPDNGAEVARHLIFMTDGDMHNRNDRPTAYGVERNEHRVTANGSSDQESRHTKRFSAVCSAIKAKGIRIWVIAFAGTTLSSNPHLVSCASDNSAFQANDANQLNEAFQEIAKQVGELRIIQ
ncbi:VWA domain-containing protein [Novosphingobium sp.]|uniref:VWA domain-containing protein n=1 Tax=Novosphingobium sp. TaxID=1874826 RepID=UPI002625CA74|nr:VWA domain-containing protein [Novosphingobium sp.]